VKKVAAAAIAFAVLTGPAFAQQKQEDPMKMIDEQKKKDAQELDKQYQETMRKTNGGTAVPAKVDPWSNLRGTTDSKASK
jgi:hypothetical protein